MPNDNVEQIAEWNGALGERWASMQREIDGVVVPFGDAALKAAAPQPGERVIDIGCGCGETAIELARRVGELGAVLGIDVSKPMLAVARSRAAHERHAHLTFRDADASQADLPSNNDLLFSRFGVMFFSQPGPAFGHLRKSLRALGRCVFVCWRTPRDNPWAMTPLIAARKAMGVTPPPADPNAPGPFAFADDDRLRTILSGAGFERIAIQRFDADVTLGATPRSAAQGALRIGPASRFAQEMGAEQLPKILDAVESALVPLAMSDGQVRLNGSTWIISASTPA